MRAVIPRVIFVRRKKNLTMLVHLSARRREGRRYRFGTEAIWVVDQNWRWAKRLPRGPFIIFFLLFFFSFSVFLFLLYLLHLLFKLIQTSF
jgi:hypothetical protein